MTTYLHATLKIRPGMMPRFNDALAEMKPALEDKGWRLVGAWTTTVGRLSEIVDIWELPDANAVADVLGAVSHDPRFPNWNRAPSGDRPGKCRSAKDSFTTPTGASECRSDMSKNRPSRGCAPTVAK